VATRNDDGEIRIWNVAEPNPAESPRVVPGPAGAGALMFAADGSFLALLLREPGRTERGQTIWSVSLANGQPHLRRLGDHAMNDFPRLDDAHPQIAVPTEGSLLWYRLAAPDGASGLMLQSGMNREVHNGSFHPSGDWIAGVQNRLTAWSLARPYPVVLPVPGRRVLFGPEGTELLAASSSVDGEGGIFSWPLAGAVPEARRRISERAVTMTLSPDGTTLSLGGRPDGRTSPLLVSRDDGSEYLLSLIHI